MIQARFAASMALLIGTSVHAFSIQEIVAQTMPLLPPYCKIKIDNGPPAQLAYWVQRLGPGFGHIHHYCFGLAQVIVAERTTEKSAKNSLLRYALVDFTYVIEKSKPSELTVMADVYVARAKVYMAQKNMPQAMADFRRADEISKGLVK